LPRRGGWPLGAAVIDDFHRLSEVTNDLTKIHSAEATCSLRFIG